MKHTITHENTLINRIKFPRPIDKTIWAVANLAGKPGMSLHPYKPVKR